MGYGARFYSKETGKSLVRFGHESDIIQSHCRCEERIVDWQE